MEIEKLHSLFLRSLSNNNIYYCFSAFVLLFTLLLHQNKICMKKLSYIKYVLQLFIVYFSYFKPKYAILLILLYVTYSLKKYKIDSDNRVKILQDKLSKKKTASKKIEKFVETSSCSVCK